ncbi:hypothetical protein JL100_031165 (plasmid) [Skermanella mucosa]|uniref:hypothetical protein n=1 Tax=Skermanella mucosa TaxID=1789672 RepID=UPI00192B1060|nr:hypothetical protein [Skermanella mucosa]UEM24669.1 hypothetical protein JL100_031165 [Skermanella mucosa]
MTDQAHEAGSCPHGIFRPTGGALAMFAFVLIALAALPLLVTDTPPIFDYPSHLARVHILAHLDRVPAFSANFTADSLLLPNVLSDLVLLALVPVLGIEPAGKVLLCLLLVLTVTGTLALSSAATGRPSVWPLLAAALVWNEVMLWGFLNYMLGVGLLLWGLAAWLYLGRLSRVGQLAAGAVFALVLLLAHMVAFGLFAVGIAALELGHVWKGRPRAVRPAARRLAASAGIFVPALALYLAASPANGLPLDLRFDFTAWQKLSPFTRLLSTGNTILDTATLAAACAAILVLLASRRVTLHRGLGGVAAIYALMVMTLPYSAMGSFFLDSRIALPAALLLVAALAPARPAPRMAVIFALGLVLVVGGRGALMAQDWVRQDRGFSAVRQSLDRLPPGAILVPAEAAPFELGDWFTTRSVHPAHEHTAAYAALQRNSVVVNIFAREGQNPLVFTPADEALLDLAVNPVARAETAEQLTALVDRVDGVMKRSGATRIYIIAFNRGCAGWPDGLPVDAVDCGAGHALMRLLSPEEREPGTEEIETVRSSS